MQMFHDNGRWKSCYLVVMGDQPSGDAGLRNMVSCFSSESVRPPPAARDFLHILSPLRCHKRLCRCLRTFKPACMACGAYVQDYKKGKYDRVVHQMPLDVCAITEDALMPNDYGIELAWHKILGETASLVRWRLKATTSESRQQWMQSMLAAQAMCESPHPFLQRF
eukprot:COSAG01_NODE_2572_length_7436_cov_3.363500_7_plen_166_part_00